MLWSFKINYCPENFGRGSGQLTFGGHIMNQITDISQQVGANSHLRSTNKTSLLKNYFLSLMHGWQMKAYAITFQFKLLVKKFTHLELLTVRSFILIKQKES